jgi:hypothetical protein
LICADFGGLNLSGRGVEAGPQELTQAIQSHPIGRWSLKMKRASPFVAVLMVLSSVALWAQAPAPGGPPSPAAATGPPLSQDPSNNNDDSGWVGAWMRIAAKAIGSQPHFVAPIVTTHVMLVQQYRFDMSWQQDPGAGTTSNYGSSRGLEIIPSTRLEIGIFPPGYLVHQKSMASGFGDLSYQVKFRAFSRTEGEGDYFVGFFFGGSVPTGRVPNGLGHAVLSPTFAAAKGLGPWDIQSTIGATLPTSGTDVLGRALLFNTEIDYKIKGKIWPMLEQNSTFWLDGPLNGHKQVFLTPGVVLGSFPLTQTLRVGFGAGVQIAVTSFHQYNHRWIFSIRFPF